VTIFLDANVIIYLVEGAKSIRDRASRTISRYREAGEARIAVSRLSWLECRIHPLRKRDQTMLKAYADFFAAPDLLIVELSAPVIEAAAQLRAVLNLSTPDALQAASALQIAGPVRLFSNDRRLAKIPGLMVELV
jgi:predicted nucleic acid-binding protein